MAYKLKSSGLPFKELGSSPAKQKNKPGSVASQNEANTKYLSEMKTYGERPTASAETKDYYEGQTKKTSVSGKLKALGRTLADPITNFGGKATSYKAEKKKERKKAHTKGKKRPSDLETLKYIKKQPRTSTTPQR